MNILADKNIPDVADACAHLGDVVLFDSRSPAELHERLKRADVLLCRSTIRVDRALLEGSRVRFVATATSGSEHVDENYLRANGIDFAAARGSNAQSVAEYVFTALFALGERKGFSVPSKSIGIIGGGHVGTWVAHIAEQLGMQVILNDPPKADETGHAMYRPIGEALAADIVTLHVPLTWEGAYPTYHLVGKNELSLLGKNAILINTARGDVVEPQALKQCAALGKLGAVVLDVFPSEPAIDAMLPDCADIATPHIAGHSFDGKLLGTQMVYESLCSFLTRRPHWNYQNILSENPILYPDISFMKSIEARTNATLRRVYDIEADAAALRCIFNQPVERHAESFAGLRNNYPIRREFHTYRISSKGLDPGTRATLLALGFQVV